MLYGICGESCMETDVWWDDDNKDTCTRCAAYAYAFGTTTKAACHGCHCGDTGIQICGCAHCDNEPAPISEPTSTEPAQAYEHVEWGICHGTIKSTNNSLNITNVEQCAASCLAEGTPYFAAACDHSGQPACRCCEEGYQHGGAGGWNVYKFASSETTTTSEPTTTTVEPTTSTEPAEAYEHVEWGICHGTIKSTNNSLNITNVEQCAASCLAEGTPYFAAACDHSGQPACRCCE